MKLRPGLVDEPGIKLGCTCDNHDPFRSRMQHEGKLQSRTELSLHEDAGHVRRQHECVELSLVDAAEDDRRSGKDVLAVSQQKIQSWPHGGDGYVDLLAGIFLAKVVPQMSEIGLRF